MVVNDFLNLVKRSRQQNTFFHFTATENMSSIRQHGLLSMKELRRRGIDHTAGGNQLSHDLDRHHGMDAYVHLCFRKQHGMAHQAQQEGRLANLKWLKIAPEVLSIPGVLVTLDNAVKNDTPAIPLLEAIDRIDSEVLYTHTKWKDPEIQARLKAAERYELLIPDHLPTTYIS
ncbi:DarT ssDNA thymidine ADP-ribosyltransferase family protein [Sphingomonas sp. Tas61C01]|uniref:DarT ssDNA thymidine ADP-ribosyltransferase family protein n=1 Tax=Sphingomonas sp. Tas61C01 TaxID=3458297 RepID=UPI00403EC331